MVSISGKPDLSADGADRVIAAAEPLYADFRCGFDVVIFAAFSFAAFLPEIASSISFCPAAAFLGFFAGFEGCSLQGSDEGAWQAHAIPRTSCCAVRGDACQGRCADPAGR